jgi:ribulose-bisphosphate carboxylase large chain
MSKKILQSSCDIPVRSSTKSVNCNRHYSFNGDYTWKGVTVEKYKQKGDDWEGIARQVLIGVSGETAKFHVRYFEIGPGGFSSFEMHNHEHVVIGIRGEGKARLNRRTVDIKHLDVLYIKPGTAHRLFNPYKEPFGFFCVVNARRDRPKSVKK